VAQGTSNPSERSGDAKLWDKAINTGQFVLATMALAGVMIGTYVTSRTQAATDEAKIEAITKQQDRMQTQLDAIGKQMNDILLGIGRVEGSVRTLNDQLSHDPAPKK